MRVAPLFMVQVIIGCSAAQVPVRSATYLRADQLHCQEASVSILDAEQAYLYQEEDLSNDEADDHFYELRIFDRDTLPLAVVRIKFISHASHYALGETGLTIDGEPAHFEVVDDPTLDGLLYFESWQAGIQVDADIATDFVDPFSEIFRFLTRDEHR